MGRAAPLILRTERSELTRNNQRIPFPTRVLEITDVSRVKQVEHAVGEDDVLPGVAQMLDKRDGFRGRQNLPAHRFGGQPLVSLMPGVKAQACLGR